MGILDLLKEDCDDLVVYEKEIPHGIQYELQISKPTKQKLYVNYYTNITISNQNGYSVAK